MPVLLNLLPYERCIQGLQDFDLPSNNHFLGLPICRPNWLRAGAMSSELCQYASLLNLFSMTCSQLSVAIGTMKTLDIWARRHSIPTYTAGRRPPDWLLALIVLTELRYESFTTNHIRVPKNQENFSEAMQLGIHTAIFAFLQTLPQNLPTVLAFEVLLAIYIIWTSLQLLLRYKSSPALFGPLYLIDSFTGFCKLAQEALWFRY